MKISVQMSSKEKKAAIIIAVILALVIYWYNRRYLYILEAQFEDDGPVSVILKTGFLLPVKTLIDLKDGFTKKIRLYKYKVNIKKTDIGFDLLLDGKKIYSIYSDEYYTKNKKVPTGRIYLS